MTRQLCEKLFNCPTAPFREGFVLEAIEEVLHANRIPYFYDTSGNLIGGWNGSAKTKSKIRLGFVAHTDHPGFHVLKQKDELVEAIWLGGAPFDKMSNAKVRIYSPHDRHWSVTGKILKVSTTRDHREGVPLTIGLTQNAPLPKHAFGAFDFKGFKKQGDKIVTRVADDLAGCAIQLGAILDSYTLAPGRAIAVFTRAEEVGFVGCLAAIQSRTLPKVPYISLEASKELEGARIGKGPVLRLGDRTSLFDTAVSQSLLAEAQKLSFKKDFMFQRRIMDGGSCEATALNISGYRASGISVPLGNYHNQSDKGPAPEIISLSDVDRGRKLCAQVILNFEPGQWDQMMKAQFKKLLSQNKKHLKLATLKNFVRQSGQWPF